VDDFECKVVQYTVPELLTEAAKYTVTTASMSLNDTAVMVILGTIEIDWSTELVGLENVGDPFACRETTDTGNIRSVNAFIKY
jgi:hypothetical protein